MQKAIFLNSTRGQVTLSPTPTPTPTLSPIDLNGEWIGYYPGHFDQVVRVKQAGDQVECVKVTGDEYVPAGEVTWQANLSTGQGQGRASEQEYRNARWVPGTLHIFSSDCIVFEWQGHGSVEYRKDD